MQQGLINHIGFVIDASDSMRPLRDEVVQVFDGQVKYLAQSSQTFDQETRATVYTFDSYAGTKCLFYDKDVLRLPSIKGLYKPQGMTPLMDAVDKAVDDLEQTAILYGDHSFLLYTLTDGEENASRRITPSRLESRLSRLSDNWTVACLVPNQQGEWQAKKFGFPAKNISIWKTEVGGVTEVGETLRRVTDTYMQARSQGIRGTKGLFELDVANLTPNVVKSVLQKLPKSSYDVFVVQGTEEIASFVARMTGRPYRVRSAYYELVKSEKIQASKEVIVVDQRTGDAYSGREARQLLGLPDYEIRAAAGDYPNYDVFIQSASTNRKLVPGQRVLVTR